MWLGGRGFPIPVPVLHRDRGCCQAPASLLAGVGLGPGGALMLPVLPARLLCHHHKARVIYRWVTPAVPSLTSASLQGCEAGDAGAVLWGKDLPFSSGKP